jgi:hypothetical protein
MFGSMVQLKKLPMLGGARMNLVGFVPNVLI